LRKLLAAVAVVLCAAPIATASPLITLTGRGWGHGVGLSQSGAEGMARDGATYDEILAHYYRGTELAERNGQGIRVLLREASAVTVRAEPGSRLKVDDAASIPVDGWMTAKPLAGGRIQLVGRDGVERGRGTVLRIGGGDPVVVTTRKYRGTIELRRFGGSVRAIDDIALEDYVRGVIAWEMPSSWHAEALGAQAVAARSYALAESASGGQFDVFSDTRSQMYGGLSAETPATDAAVAATQDKVLTYKGRVATTFFFSSSGGRTANVEDIWNGSPIPYLVAVDDPGDAIATYHRWVPRTFTATGLGKLFGISPVRTISIVRNKSGRVGTLTLTTSRGGTRVLRGSEARTLGALRSTWFSLRLLDLQRATRTSKGVHVLGRTSPNGSVGLEGLIDGTWRRLKTVKSKKGRVVFDVATKGATQLRLRASDAVSKVVSAP
jgi:stage II sporulation protein D